MLFPNRQISPRLALKWFYIHLYVLLLYTFSLLLIVRIHSKESIKSIISKLAVAIPYCAEKNRVSSIFIYIIYWARIFHIYTGLYYM